MIQKLTNREGKSKVKLKEIITQDLILSDMKARSNNEAIQELVELLVQNGKIPGEYVVEAQLALFKREALGSTGIGQGLAIPHGRIPFVHDIIGAMGISSEGLDFRSLDGEPVHVIFLFLSPQHKPDLHLKMMSLVNGLSKSPKFIESLMEASSLEEIVELIKKAESIVFPKIE